MFLARTDEQRRFEVALEEIRRQPARPGASQVLLLHGLGGMGKTELCRRFTAIARGDLGHTRGNARKYIVAAVNWQDERGNHTSDTPDPIGAQPRDVVPVLFDAIANNADVRGRRRLRSQADSAFEAYRRAMAQFSALRTYQPTAADRDQGLGPVVELGIRSAGAIGTSATGNPVSSVAAEGVARAARVARQSKDFAVDADQLNVALRPEESITREFAHGLFELSKRRPIVVILDTYEIISSCGSWIRQLMRNSGERVLWVVAARLEPESKAGTGGELAAFRREIPEGHLRIIAMSKFERDTIAEELTQRKVSGADDPETIDAVATLTRGVPLAVGLVAGMMAQGEELETIGQSVTPKGDTSTLVRELAERYLLHALNDPGLNEDIPLLYRLALLYADEADPDVIRALWDRETDVAETLDDLAWRHDFVLTGSRRLHQEVREVIRLYLLDKMRRAEFVEANRRAAEVLTGRAEGCVADDSIEARVASDEWRSAVIALTWHRFWEDNDAGMDSLCEIFPAAVLLQRAFAHELVDMAATFKGTFNADQERLHRGLTSLLSSGNFLDGWLAKRRDALSREPSPAIEGSPVDADKNHALDVLVRRAQGDLAMPFRPAPEAIAKLLSAKSSLANDPEAALLTLEEATRALPAGKGALAGTVGWTARMLANALLPRSSDEGRSSSAGLSAAQLRARYEPESANARFGLAVAFETVGKTNEAIRCYGELVDKFGDHTAVEIRRLVARSVLSKAVAQGRIGCKGKEVEGYDRVIALYRDDDDRQLRREVALAFYNKAGRLIDAEEGDEAIALYDEVVRRSKNEADTYLRQVAVRCLFGKGNILNEQDRESEALETYRQVVDLYGTESDPEIRATAVRALFNTGYRLAPKNTEKAISVFGQLIDRFGEDDVADIRWIVARAYIQRFFIERRDGKPTPSAGDLRSTVDALLSGLEPTRADILGEYALFFADAFPDEGRARDLFEQALAAGPVVGNVMGTFARLLFEQGELKEAAEMADRSLERTTENEAPVELEVHFYILALGDPSRFDVSLAEVRRLLEAGVRSRAWSFDRILARAERESRADLEWMRLLSEVINDVRSPQVLSGWEKWALEEVDGSPGRDP